MWVEDLGQYLADSDLGTIGDDLWMGFLPEDDNMGITTALSLEGGNVTHVGRGQVDRPLLVIEVRSPSYVEAYERITAIRSLLSGVVNETIGGTYFIGILPVDTPEDSGRDARNRQVFTTRCEVLQ